MENEVSAPQAMNISSPERVVSLVAGSFLLIDSIFNRHFRLPKALAAGYMLYRGATGNCSLYALSGKESVIQSKNINIRVEMFIDKPRVQVYETWSNLENLPHFMKHLKSVKNVHDDITEWKANIPGKLVPIQWRAATVRNEPGEMISWRSLPGSAIENAGKVEFRDEEPGVSTTLHVTITYHPPMGLAGNALAEFFQPALERIVREDIFRFKEFIETPSGEAWKMPAEQWV
ncbi:MAG: DUF2892 domain-containing protein [Gemmatimonadaceae bacterium]|nr:DUF2892 domain-containing protein [Chitinophagaceae bacterium]